VLDISPVGAEGVPEGVSLDVDVNTVGGGGSLDVLFLDDVG